jgi:hypothetical protein
MEGTLTINVANVEKSNRPLDISEKIGGNLDICRNCIDDDVIMEVGPAHSLIP